MSLAKNFISMINDSDAKIANHEQNSFYNKHNQCCLCNHKLTVEVQISTDSLILNEKISCRNCKVTVSTAKHSLN